MVKTIVRLPLEVVTQLTDALRDTKHFKEFASVTVEVPKDAVADMCQRTKDKYDLLGEQLLKLYLSAQDETVDLRSQNKIGPAHGKTIGEQLQKSAASYSSSSQDVLETYGGNCPEQVVDVTERDAPFERATDSSPKKVQNWKEENVHPRRHQESQYPAQAESDLCSQKNEPNQEILPKEIDKTSNKESESSAPVKQLGIELRQVSVDSVDSHLSENPHSIPEAALWFAQFPRDIFKYLTDLNWPASLIQDIKKIYQNIKRMRNDKAHLYPENVKVNRECYERMLEVLAVQKYISEGDKKCLWSLFQFLKTVTDQDYIQISGLDDTLKRKIREIGPLSKKPNTKQGGARSRNPTYNDDKGAKTSEYRRKEREYGERSSQETVGRVPQNRDQGGWRGNRKTHSADSSSVRNDTADFHGRGGSTQTRAKNRDKPGRYLPPYYGRQSESLSPDEMQAGYDEYSRRGSVSSTSSTRSMSYDGQASYRGGGEYSRRGSVSSTSSTRSMSYDGQASYPGCGYAFPHQTAGYGGQDQAAFHGYGYAGPYQHDVPLHRSSSVPNYGNPHAAYYGSYGSMDYGTRSMRDVSYPQGYNDPNYMDDYRSETRACDTTTTMNQTTIDDCTQQNKPYDFYPEFRKK